MTDTTRTKEVHVPHPIELSLETAAQISAGSRAVEFGSAIAAFVLSHMML